MLLLQEEYNHVGNPCNITPEEYFDDAMDLKGRDIGRPKEVNTKIQKFKVVYIFNVKFKALCPAPSAPLHHHQLPLYV
jgi:hypothetical protein